MSAFDIVEKRIGKLINDLAQEVMANPEEGFQIWGAGTSRVDEVHFIVRRGNEQVRITIEAV